MAVLRDQLLLALGGLAGLTGHSADALADEQDRSTAAADPREIVVMGANRQYDPLAGLLAEAELDEGGIAAYGHDTVRDLLGEVLRQVDNSTEGPVVLINGQPTLGMDAVSDLPTEAVARIQLLPREAAARIGERPSRRVINVVIKPSHRQATINGSAAMATAGGAFMADGELNLLRLKDGDRSSLVLSARHSEPLFESDRPILISPALQLYNTLGNILPDPMFGAEIDPALSLLAGQAVQVAGIPAGIAQPALRDFATLANRPNLGVPARNRTLVSDQQSVSLNANLSRKLSPRTTLSLNFRASHSRVEASTGLASAAFRLPVTSPFSPFGRDVLIARSLGEPLRNQNEGTDLSLAAIINATFGKWRFSAGGNFHHRNFDVQSQRSHDTAAYQAGISAGLINPFAPDSAAALAGPRTDLSKMRSDQGAIFAVVSGSPWQMPAGPANAALRFEWRTQRIATSNRGETINVENRLNRDEASVQLSLQVPLLGGRRSSAIGDLDLELSGTFRKLSATRALRDYGAALNWRPGTTVTLRAEISEQQIAPPANLLTDPDITTENVRTFDFVRQETVFVRQITGGNPGLGVETRRTAAVSGTLLPFGSPDFSLNAEYARTVNRDTTSSLPPANAAVQAAFPDRFVRDSSGRLIAVDARPVTFARLAQSQIRWGFNFNRRFKSSAAPTLVAAPSADPDAANVLAPGLRINAFGTHTWTLSGTQLIRTGLPVVDLLAGGASASAIGSIRHIVQFGAGLTEGGFGVQMNGTRLGSREIAAGSLANPDPIRFAARTQIDLRLFANLGSLFPNSAFASGARFTVEMDNLLDTRQRVTDRQGQTPERYQSYLLDPVGRRITIKLRKVI